LFNRLGRIFGGWVNVEQYQLYALPNIEDCIADQFNDNRDYIAGLRTQISQAQQSQAQAKNEFVTEATKTVIEVVHADNPLPEKTITFSLDELIDQMNGQGETVDSCNTSIAVSPGGSNVGNGQCVASIVNPDGVRMENVYAEDIVISCSQDSQPGTGNTTVNSEVFTARGEARIGDTDFNWPGGSGGSTQVVVANPATEGSTINLLTNGSFEDFTGNAPDSWTIVTGTAGTTLSETTTSYVGTNALSLIGTGAAERTRIAQQLRASPTTPGLVEPKTRYAIGFWCRVSVVPSQGTLRVSLRDGTTDGATVIGGAHATIDLTGETTSYAFHSVQVLTPADLPDNIYCVVELTVAIESGKSVYVDQLSITEMVRHENGPYFAVFPGSTPFLTGDVFTATVTNNLAGRFQMFFNRAFGMLGRGIQLPTDEYGAETIDDALISC